MKIVVQRKFAFSFFHFHRWSFKFSTGANVYSQCDKCGARKVISSSGGYQPVAFEWLQEDARIKPLK